MRVFEETARRTPGGKSAVGEAMTIVDRLFARLTGAGLILMLAIAPASPAQQAAVPDPGQNAAAQEPAGARANELPDSPGAMRAQAIDAVQSQNGAPQAPPPPAQEQTQGTTSEPAGTAAAETVKTTGVAASRPAGAAIAPAKQRRVRSILIKIGAIAGAGAAVGTTVALSKGSPSKPPGH